MGVGRVGDRVMPFAARYDRIEGTRYHRRNPGSALRARRRSASSAGWQADAAFLGRTARGGLIAEAMMHDLGSRGCGVPTMFDERLARLRTHRNNIHRYRRLLLTTLTDVERAFIDRRMSEEQTALDALVAETFPIAFYMPAGNAAS